MSNVAEIQKLNDKARLKASRAEILNATTGDDLRKSVVDLQLLLCEMEQRVTGETQQTIQRTLQEIKRFWLHDTTRAEVCKWAQGIICKLNQE